MSGLLALLDDVAAIAKVAAASVDDVIGQAAKAGAKAAGAVIDDAALTPKYVQGFSPRRELPIVWRIARGSIFNKMVILLPIALALSAFAPFLIAPLLMLGGAYLCFEGAEKVFHVLFPHADPAVARDMTPKDPGHLEEERVKGAIKTDFILSAEIMTIALNAIETDDFWLRAATLAVVALGITVAVYGGVAVIVKADDVGLHMANRGRLGLTRRLGQGIVKGMPTFLKLLMIVGTAAMLWVGGSIIVHALHELGWHGPYDAIHHLAGAVAPDGFLNWLIVALCDGILGLVLGLLLIPVVLHGIAPAMARLTGKGAAH